MTDWAALARGKQERYELTHGELDERGTVRRGNLAYAAGLALLMDRRSNDAGRWLRLAAARWRESWDLGAGVDAWGRPVGALKASLLADDAPGVELLAGWTLSLGAAEAASPIGRYAAALALLATGRAETARPLAAGLGGEQFPDDVATALEAVARRDGAGFAGAVDSVVRSFEARAQYLEDVPVADTALVLGVLARRSGLSVNLPASILLPSLRPARSPDETRS